MEIVALAPRETWMPFWAIRVVGPQPVTVVFVIFAVVPGPSTVIPFFCDW